MKAGLRKILQKFVELNPITKFAWKIGPDSTWHCVFARIRICFSAVFVFTLFIIRRFLIVFLVVLAILTLLIVLFIAATQDTVNASCNAPPLVVFVTLSILLSVAV